MVDSVVDFESGFLFCYAFSWLTIDVTGIMLFSFFLPGFLILLLLKLCNLTVRWYICGWKIWWVGIARIICTVTVAFLNTEWMASCKVWVFVYSPLMTLLLAAFAQVLIYSICFDVKFDCCIIYSYSKLFKNFFHLDFECISIVN